MRALAAVALALSLSACGLITQPGGPGNTDASISADGSMSYRSGKDFALIKGKFSRPDGLTGEFEAHGVDAQAGIKAQADAMAAQAALVGKLLDQLGPLIGRFAGAAAGVP